MDSNRTLTEAHKGRRGIENDAQLLSNRIRLLQKEEEKTLKKIKETKKITQDRIRILQEKEERKLFKLRMKEQEIKELNEMRLRNFEIRESIRKKNLALQLSLKEKKVEDAEGMRMLSTTNNARYLNYLKKFERFNRQRHSSVKEQHKMQSTRLKQYKLDRKSEARKDYIRRIQFEDQLKSQKEKEVEEMEKLEAQLIRSLQNTQQIQKETFGDLKKVLNKQLKC